MKLELNGKGVWEKLSNDSSKGIYIDGYLKEKLDNILYIQKREWDAMILIDGKERSGKSMLGMTCAWYLSHKKLTINNFAKGLEDAKKKIAELPDKSVLMVDEASLIFNTKDSRTKASVQLQKIMDVVGQKNMIFILILPSVFDLAKSLATRRSLFLLHVFVNEKWERGRFGYYGEGEKEKLYVEGKKNYNKYIVRPEFVAKFTKFEPPFYEEYLELKKATLLEAINSPDDNKTVARLKNKLNKSELDLVKVIDYSSKNTNLTKTELYTLIRRGKNWINEKAIKIKGDMGDVPIPSP